MNKLLIILLAICLVSVHGFVKRDAPATEKNIIDDIKKFGENMGEQIKTAFEPAEKQLNEFIEKAKTVFSPSTAKPPQ